MRIINYNKKYQNDINLLQQMQWGEGSDSDDITSNLDKYQIKLIKDKNNIVGAMVWHITDLNTCYLDFIIIKPEYQRMGGGTKLIKILIDYAIDHNCNKIECEAIDVRGHINSKRLLENFGFVEKYKIENYWGDKYPDFNCKECGSQPCICTMHKYEKHIIKKT